MRRRRSCSRCTRCSASSAASSCNPPATASTTRVVADAIAAKGGAYCGVALAPATVDDAELRRLDGLGFRGVRFNFMKHLGAGAPIADVIALSARLAPLGWHLQIHLDSALIEEMTPWLAALRGAGRHRPHGARGRLARPRPAGLPAPARADARRAFPGEGQRRASAARAAVRPTPMRFRSRARWSRSSATGRCGAPTGRIRTSPAVPGRRRCSSICSPRSRPPRRSARRCSWTTRSASTASRCARAMTGRLQDRVAIVTGAGSVGPGLGQRARGGGALRRRGRAGVRGGPGPGPARGNRRARSRGRRRHRDPFVRRHAGGFGRRDGARLPGRMGTDRRPGQQRRRLCGRRPGRDVGRGLGRADRPQPEERLPDVQARASGDGGPGRAARSSTSPRRPDCAGPAPRRWPTRRRRPG